MLHEEWIGGTIERLGIVAMAVRSGNDEQIGLALATLLAYTGAWGEWTAATTNDERITIMVRAGL